MATNITVVVSGITDIVSYLDRLRTRIEKPSQKLMYRMQEEAVDETERRWFANGDGEWQPLKVATVQRKMKKTGSAFPLIDSGVMFSSIETDRTDLKEITLRIPYGSRKRNPDIPRYHQYGTKYIPARPMLKKTPMLVARMSKLMLDYVLKIISDKDY